MTLPTVEAIRARHGADETLGVLASELGEAFNAAHKDRAALLAHVERLGEALKLTQFGFNHARCPLCAGWAAGPGGRAQGEADRVHTEECLVAAALKSAGII